MTAEERTRADAEYRANEREIILRRIWEAIFVRFTARAGSFHEAAQVADAAVEHARTHYPWMTT